MAGAKKDHEATYRWLSTIFRNDPKKGGPIKLELRHKSDSQDGGIIDTWDPERWDKISPHEVGDELIAAATEDAKAFKGTQAYIILVYRAAREEPTGRHVFHVKGTRWEDGIEETEAPTEKGYTSQMMRHNENIQRMAHRSIEKANEMLLTTIDKQQSAIDRLSQREFETVQLIQQLMDRQQDRKLEFMKEQNTEALRVDLMTMARRFVPFIGMKALPGNSQFEQMTIEAFLETLRPEQVDQIVTVLSKKQVSLLFRVMKSKGADKEAMIEMIGSTDDGQYAALMGCLSPDQQGVLGEWFMKQVAERQKAEEQKPLQVTGVVGNGTNGTGAH